MIETLHPEGAVAAQGAILKWTPPEIEARLTGFRKYQLLLDGLEHTRQKVYARHQT